MGQRWLHTAMPKCVHVVQANGGARHRPDQRNQGGPPASRPDRYVAGRTALGLWWKTFKRLWTAKMSAASLSAGTEAPAHEPTKTAVLLGVAKDRLDGVRACRVGLRSPWGFAIGAPSVRAGSRPLVAGRSLAISRDALRCFQSLVVAMRRSGDLAVALSSDQ